MSYRGAEFYNRQRVERWWQRRHQCCQRRKRREIDCDDGDNVTEGHNGDHGPSSEDEC